MFLKGKIRRHTRQVQLNDFLRVKSSHGLHLYRKSWYHDPLILSLDFPSARTIRKMRVGSFELACDSFFHNANKSKMCQECSSGAIESHDHYFIRCEGFSTQRDILIRQIRPILARLNISFSASTCLGFNTNLGNREYEKTTRQDRQSIFDAINEFILSTDRFSYL